MLLSDPRLLNFKSFADFCDDKGGLEFAPLANPPVSALSVRDPNVAVFFKVYSFIFFMSVNSEALSFIVSRPFGSRGVELLFFPSESGSVVHYWLKCIDLKCECYVKVVAFLRIGSDFSRGDIGVSKVLPRGFVDAWICEISSLPVRKCSLWCAFKSTWTWLSWTSSTSCSRTGLPPKEAGACFSSAGSAASGSAGLVVCLASWGSVYASASFSCLEGEDWASISCSAGPLSSHV